MTHPNILVLDANQRSALAVTRSLGKLKSVRVLTSDNTPKALAGCSRYSSQYIQLPDPANEPQAFLEQLQQQVNVEKISYLQPVTEITCRLILENADRFDTCILPFSDYDTVLNVSNKQSLMQKAAELGVPIPQTSYYDHLEQWGYTQPPAFPFVIKPSLSRIKQEDKWISTTVRIIKTTEDLNNCIKVDQYLQTSPFMVQSFIPGHGEGVFALYDHGEPVCHFSHQRLREKPPEGGVSVLSKAKTVDPVIKDYADRLLQAYDWSGVAMIEFRVASDGTPYLMEINTRFWGSLQLSIDSGVDFPALLYKQFAHKEKTPAPVYNTKQKLRWFLGDLDSLYLFLRNPKNSFTLKLKRIFSFMALHLNTKNELCRLNDIKPAIYEFKQYLFNFINK